MSVFQRRSGSHLHIRTSITLALVVLLVLLLSAFCYYRTSAPAERGRIGRAPAEAVAWR